tara:strand:- start:107 stop:352 length:246 start_codon:yes stop_codon:yes gene_type:complete
LLLSGISSSPVLTKKNHDGKMNFADSWARVFVVITFLTFGEAHIIGGIVPNLITFTLFLGAIGYFASTGKMAELFGRKDKR